MKSGSTSHLSLIPLGGVIGAEVCGLGLSRLPTADELAFLEDALERFGVLVFPSQDISPCQQVAFTRALGALESTRRVNARHPDYPEIFVVGNAGQPLVTFSPSRPEGELEWHTDHIHLPVPARASLLYALEVPPVGGDTLFACLYSGYEALSEAERARCDTMTAVHSIHGLRRYLAREQLGPVHTMRGAAAAACSCLGKAS